jgi:hypothetical protein
MARRNEELVQIGPGGIHYGSWKWSGNFALIDLIAASTNALNGALLARRPDHYKNFTVVGVLLMALLGGLQDPRRILLPLSIGYVIAIPTGSSCRNGGGVVFRYRGVPALPGGHTVLLRRP